MVYSDQDEEKEAQDDSADCIYQKLLRGKEATTKLQRMLVPGMQSGPGSENKRKSFS